jgi:hypothetical protein
MAEYFMEVCFDNDDDYQNKPSVALTPRGRRDTPFGTSRMRWKTEAVRGRFRIPRNYEHVDRD